MPIRTRMVGVLLAAVATQGAIADPASAAIVTPSPSPSQSRTAAPTATLTPVPDLTITKPATPGEVTPAPATVVPGILTRFRDLVRQVKAASAYTDAMGTALGIIGPDSADVDPATLVPEISLRLNGGKVDVLWTKNGQEALEIQVDRGTGTFDLLAIDTRPDYTDTEPLPATPARWKYRATYTHDAQRIGQWSNVAEIAVGG